MEEFKTGAIHALKVAAWIAGSAIVAFLVAHGVDGFAPGFSDKWPFLAPIINIIAVGVQKWLSENPS